MALSLLARGASSKMNGCSGRLLCQNAMRLSSSAFQNASFKLARPLQPFAANLLEKSSQQSALVKMDYSSAAPATQSGSHVTLWILERVVSASLVVIVPLAIAMPSKPLDVLLAVSLVAHTYWGFEAIVKDYVRTLIFGSVVPKVCHVLLALLMMVTLGGLFYLIFDDVGLAGSIRRLWSIKPKNQTN